MSNTSRYKGKAVGIIGLSVEGSDSATFFAGKGARVICFDRRTREELGRMVDGLSPFVDEFRLGPDYLSRLEDLDCIVRTPGMHPRTHELTAAQQRGTEITTQTKLFFQHCTAPVIGVTGTKGKGTTSTLIARMLEWDGKTVHLGGNVGVPLLSKIDTIKSGDWVVLELSSFQLEDLEKSPTIAVILKTTQDHLANFDKLATNFHETVEDYVRAKTSIVRFQKKDDTAIFNMDDETSRSFASMTCAKQLFFSRTSSRADAFVHNNRVYLVTGRKPQEICSSSNVQIPGVHNLENIAAASLAAHAAGATIHAIGQAAIAFQGLPYRLQLVGSIDGVSYYNDSFSTVPDTTIAAIEAFDQPKILILGGSEKKSDFHFMGQAIARGNVRAILVVGQMSERIMQAVDEAGFDGITVTGLTTMGDIVRRARTLAHSGDVVILTPACASFDMFKNYKDRGNQFTHEVSQL